MEGLEDGGLNNRIARVGVKRDLVKDEGIGGRRYDWSVMMMIGERRTMAGSHKSLLCKVEEVGCCGTEIEFRQYPV